MKPLNYLLHISNLSLFLVLFGVGNSKAQIINLVPDPSFEDTLPVVGYVIPLALKSWGGLHLAHPAACRTVYFYTGNMDVMINNFNQVARSGEGGGLVMSFLALLIFVEGWFVANLRAS
jgi:hypothetical protein